MDHHSEYLAKAINALTPEGHERVDELRNSSPRSSGTTRQSLGSPRLERPRPNVRWTEASSVAAPDAR